MGAGQVGGKDRGGVERRNGQMRALYEKGRKLDRKGGHIVESRPGLLFVHFADKSLFVALPTIFSLPSHPLFSKHVPAWWNTSLLRSRCTYCMPFDRLYFSSHWQHTESHPCTAAGCYTCITYPAFCLTNSRSTPTYCTTWVCFSSFSANASRRLPSVLRGYCCCHMLL